MLNNIQGKSPWYYLQQRRSWATLLPKFFVQIFRGLIVLSTKICHGNLKFVPPIELEILRRLGDQVGPLNSDFMFLIAIRNPLALKMAMAIEFT